MWKTLNKAAIKLMLLSILLSNTAFPDDVFSIPTIPTNHPVLAVVTADMTGDGLEDIVTVESDIAVSIKQHFFCKFHLGWT